MIAYGGLALALLLLLGVLRMRARLVQLDLDKAESRGLSMATNQSREVQPITMAMPAIQTCQKCQSPNPWNTDVCKACGEKLVEKATCLSCSRKSPANKTACIYCGGALQI